MGKMEFMKKKPFSSRVFLKTWLRKKKEFKLWGFEGCGVKGQGN